MTSRSRLLSASILGALGLLASLTTTGCEEKKDKPVELVDAGPVGPEKPVLDGKLGAAVAAASAQQQPSGGGKGGGADGPPENGVFGPGLADKALAPNAPPKVEVVSEGAEPRFTLPVPAVTDEEQRVTLTAMLRLGGQAGPVSADYTLGIKADRGGSKDDKAKDDKAKDAKDRKADAAPTNKVVATILAVTPAAQLPKQLGDQFLKFKGTEIHYELSPRGGITNLSVNMSKDADPGLDAPLRALIDGLSLIVSPVPEKPVGVGGFWMVTDRATSFGVEAVRYRVFKIDSISKDTASLTVDVRLYATNADIELGPPGKGQKIGLLRFEAQGKEKLDYTGKQLVPRGEGVQKMAIIGTAQGQQAGVQTELGIKAIDAAPAGKADPKK